MRSSITIAPFVAAAPIPRAPNRSTTSRSEKKEIAINARLLGDFDLDVVPVEVLDGKNLW
jgi:hypothetical protein